MERILEGEEMNWNTWKAKRLVKRIEKNEAYIIRLIQYKAEAQKWIKRDMKALKKRIKEMSSEDYILFGIKTGYLEEQDVKRKI